MTCLVRPHPVLAAFGNPAVSIRVVEERCEIAVTAHQDVTSPATVSTIRTTHRNPVLTPERGTAGSAGSSFHLHDYAINEHRKPPSSRAGVGEQEHGKEGRGIG